MTTHVEHVKGDSRPEATHPIHRYRYTSRLYHALLPCPLAVPTPGIAHRAARETVVGVEPAPAPARPAPLGTTTLTTNTNTTPLTTNSTYPGQLLIPRSATAAHPQVGGGVAKAGIVIVVRVHSAAVTRTGETTARTHDTTTRAAR